jgi:MFS family permease|eukprot:COSAG01_NODE_9621_length_2386_cov_70.481288_3_plen_207_part_00
MGIALSDYCALLRSNRRFRYLFAAYLVTNSGNWINYVAALAFVRMLLGVGSDTAGGGRGAAAITGGSASSAEGVWADDASAEQDTAARSQASAYTAAFMFVRMLPPIVLAPCIGALAERVDKRKGLVCCDLGAALCVGAMLWLSAGLDQGREGLDGEPGLLVWPAFFALVFLQQSFAAQYDPLRGALVPEVVRTRMYVLNSPQRLH